MDAFLKCMVILISLCLINTSQAYDSTRVSPVSTTALRPYTESQALPTDIANFSNAANYLTNKCKQTNETRQNCVVRYEARKLYKSAGSSWSSGGGAQTIPYYIWANKSLSCPTGYFITATFGNQLFDLTDHAEGIYYFDQKTIFPVPYSQYETVKDNPDLVCTFSATDPVVNSGSHCISPGCSARAQQYINVNGNLAMLSWTSTYKRETWNQGIKKCEVYTLSDCSTSTLCSHMTWEGFKYTNARCSIPAGIYSSTDGEGASSRYVPSTIICSKPQVMYKEAK